MRSAHRSRPDGPCASRSIISENQFSGILPAAIARMPALLVLYAASGAVAAPPREMCPHQPSSLPVVAGMLPSICSRAT